MLIAPSAARVTSKLRAPAGPRGSDGGSIAAAAARSAVTSQARGTNQRASRALHSTFAVLEAKIAIVMEAKRQRKERRAGVTR